MEPRWRLGRGRRGRGRRGRHCGQGARARVRRCRPGHRDDPMERRRGDRRLDLPGRDPVAHLPGLVRLQPGRPWPARRRDPLEDRAARHRQGARRREPAAARQPGARLVLCGRPRRLAQAGAAAARLPAQRAGTGGRHIHRHPAARGETERDHPNRGGRRPGRRVDRRAARRQLPVHAGGPGGQHRPDAVEEGGVRRAHRVRGRLRAAPRPGRHGERAGGHPGRQPRSVLVHRGRYGAVGRRARRVDPGHRRPVRTRAQRRPHVRQGGRPAHRWAGVEPAGGRQRHGGDHRPGRVHHRRGGGPAAGAGAGVEAGAARREELRNAARVRPDRGRAAHQPYHRLPSIRSGCVGCCSVFSFSPLLPLGPDSTEYRLVTTDGIEFVDGPGGQRFLTVAPAALTALTAEAMHDIAHYLRPAHLAQLRSIIDDPAASPNARFVALDLLRNANIAAGGVLPMCQDTGTAIVMGKRGRFVLTDGRDEEAISRGVYDAYTTLNLRYSQLAPLTMWEERNTGSHLPIVVGGTSAEYALKTAKLASAKYLDSLPTSGSMAAHGFRDLALEAEVLELTREFGIGAQFGGRYFCHDVRVVRLPRHGASCPVAIAVSCSADRQAVARITAEGVFLERLETDPARFLPETTSDDLGGDVVRIDLNRPMDEVRAELSRYPVKTRLSLTGPLVVARDIAHAKIKELLDAGHPMPAYLRDHAVYYAGPAKTPPGYASGSFGPTTAGRMDSYVAQFQEAGGSLVMLAKGNRSEQVTRACEEFGGFYLGSVGGPAARLAADCIRRVEVLEYAELGMEAIWRIEVEDFPAFIVVDDKGNDALAETTRPVALTIGPRPSE